MNICYGKVVNKLGGLIEYYLKDMIGNRLYCVSGFLELIKFNFV